jgi:hypothetical protein
MSFRFLCLLHTTICRRELEAPGQDDAHTLTTIIIITSFIAVPALIAIVITDKDPPDSTHNKDPDLTAAITDKDAIAVPLKTPTSPTPLRHNGLLHSANKKVALVLLARSRPQNLSLALLTITSHPHHNKTFTAIWAQVSEDLRLDSDRILVHLEMASGRSLEAATLIVPDVVSLLGFDVFSVCC